MLEKQAPLEDLMAAMDVVDTLRHQRGIAAREMGSDGRRERLLERLKELYLAQGIAVSEYILQEGVDALEQERFQYHPVKSSWRTRLARLWVSRSRWGKPVVFLSFVGALLGSIYYVVDVYPEQQLQAAIPKQISASLSTIKIIDKNHSLKERSDQRAAAARRAISAGDFDQAKEIQINLKNVSDRIQQEFQIRVVSYAGKPSGVWRVSDDNKSARNYYLIVEAVDSENRILEQDILNEETNKIKRVNAWGLRVDQATFNRISADKQDDGIIQNNKVGIKKIGYLEAEFLLSTAGASITDW